MEGVKEGGREGRKEAGREGGREEGREEGREGRNQESKGARKGDGHRFCICNKTNTVVSHLKTFTISRRISPNTFIGLSFSSVRDSNSLLSLWKSYSCFRRCISAARTQLYNACSVSSILLTTVCKIDAKKKKNISTRTGNSPGSPVFIPSKKNRVEKTTATTTKEKQDNAIQSILKQVDQFLALKKRVKTNGQKQKQDNRAINLETAEK